MFTFGLADTSVSIPFSVDANTGVISVSGSLDYERTQAYSFMVNMEYIFFHRKYSVF